MFFKNNIKNDAQRRSPTMSLSLSYSLDTNSLCHCIEIQPKPFSESHSVEFPLVLSVFILFDSLLFIIVVCSFYMLFFVKYPWVVLVVVLFHLKCSSYSDHAHLKGQRLEKPKCGRASRLTCLLTRSFFSSFSLALQTITSSSTLLLKSVF